MFHQSAQKLTTDFTAIPNKITADHPSRKATMGFNLGCPARGKIAGRKGDQKQNERNREKENWIDSVIGLAKTSPIDSYKDGSPRLSFREKTKISHKQPLSQIMKLVMGAQSENSVSTSQIAQVLINAQTGQVESPPKALVR